MELIIFRLHDTCQFSGGVCTLGHKEYHNIFHLSIDQLKLAINGTKAFTLLAASRVNQTANLTPWQFPKKSQGTEPCKKEIPFGTDQFWNLLFLASRCIFGRFQQIQALSSCLVKTHLWTLRKEPFPLPRYPKTLQHGNLPKAKTSCLANKPTFISTPAQVPVGHPAAEKDS